MELPLLRLNIPDTLQPGRFVLVGGPGQGKSTLGQFICQLYRASILIDRPTHSLTVEVTTTLNLIKQQCQACGVELPAARRFPVRVVLDQFANDLATRKVTSLLLYLAQRIKSLTDYECTMTDLRRWLGAYPWLIVLDGLDEVPPTSNRAEVLDRITDFWTERNVSITLRHLGEKFRLQVKARLPLPAVAAGG
jgi:predicted NACHT family NTPase